MTKVPGSAPPFDHPTGGRPAAEPLEPRVIRIPANRRDSPTAAATPRRVGGHGEDPGRPVETKRNEREPNSDTSIASAGWRAALNWRAAGGLGRAAPAGAAPGRAACRQSRAGPSRLGLSPGGTPAEAQPPRGLAILRPVPVCPFRLYSVVLVVVVVVRPVPTLRRRVEVVVDGAEDLCAGVLELIAGMDQRRPAG